MAGGGLLAGDIWTRVSCRGYFFLKTKNSLRSGNMQSAQQLYPLGPKAGSSHCHRRVHGPAGMMQPLTRCHQAVKGGKSLKSATAETADFF